MNILLTGSEGQLGKSIIATLPKNINIIQTNKKNLDICNFKQLNFFFEKYKPKFVINAAAYTDVENSEKNKKLAFNVNSDGPKNLAHFSNVFKSILVHFSTDYVFDGKKDKPYLESDITNPISVYGKSKLLGEKNIIDSCSKYLVIRLAWLYSPYNNSNFLNSMIDLSKKRNTINIVNDQMSIPTSSIVLSKNLWQIINQIQLNIGNFNSNTYHFSQYGKIISFYDYAKFIFDYMSAKKLKVPVINPISSQNYTNNIIRPLFSALNNDKLLNYYKLNIENWQDSMRNIIDYRLRDY